ncbi:MAG: CotH kinase family protein [Bacteroidetes bacterium]|nr:CotH kinase family protein [Bacteroidota bacterium]
MKIRIKSLSTLLFCLLISINLLAQNKPRIFINEFLASNISTNPDMVDFGDFSDWIELYNDEDSDFDLGGYYLTDDFAILNKWQFPSNTIIPAKEFYLIWADDFNDVPGNIYERNWWPDGIEFTTKWCHTNFKLNKDGDGIGLFDQVGNIIDSVFFTAQVTDVSSGRQPDGSNNWFYFSEPTPLNSNTSIGLNSTNISGDVNFSYEGGFYESTVQIELTSSSGFGIIRYTTNGSKPNTFSKIYSSPLAVDENTVFRARVFEEWKLPGITTSNSYFIGEERNLPAVSLTADPTFLRDRQLGIYLNSYKERQIPVSLEYFPLNSGRAFAIDAGARIGGENIYRFAQKPFNIVTSSDYGYSHIEYKVFDDLPFQKYKRLYLRNSGDSTDFVSLMTVAREADLRDSSYYEYVTSRIDIHDLMDFVIVQDYLANSSWGHNREVWRDNKTENLWHWVLVDMDRGFYADKISANQFEDIYDNFELFRKLCANTKFQSEFLQRYAERMNHTFGAQRVIGKIDSLKSLIQNEMPNHIQKWGTYIDSLTIDLWGETPGVSSISKWNSEVEEMKDFASQRAIYAEQYLSEKFDLNGRANLKITFNVPTQGKVSVNSFPANWNEDNLFFMHVPLSIQVYPPPGYKFKQWKQINLSINLTLFPAGSVWKYRDEASAPDNSWKNIDYDDTAWKSGNAQFGYGDGDENTVISYGGNSQNKHITSYYRRSFQVENPAHVKDLKLKLLRDDGAVVYLNGNEIVRSNMPAGSVSNTTRAVAVIGGNEELTFFEFTFDNSNLAAGENVIAVEVHQANATSSNLSFDLSLSANLYQQSTIENVIGADQAISITIPGDTELISEFEAINSSEVAQVINEPVTLTKSNSPYFVTNDVTVETNGILTIEPGTEIYFSSGKGILAKGKVLMTGTQTEPITLTSYYPNDKWGALCFDSSAGISSNINTVGEVYHRRSFPQ